MYDTYNKMATTLWLEHAVMCTSGSGYDNKVGTDSLDYIYIYIYLFIYLCIYIYIYVYIYVCMLYIAISVYLSIYIYVFLCIVYSRALASTRSHSLARSLALDR